MQLRWLAVLGLVTLGCKGKPTEGAPAPAGAPVRARVAAPVAPDVPPLPTAIGGDDAGKLKVLDAQLDDAAQARKTDPRTTPRACTGAKLSLITLSQIAPATLAPRSARYDASCSLTAVAALNLPSDVAAPASALQDAVPAIEASYRAQAYAPALARCLTSNDALQALSASTDPEVGRLRSKADRLCNLLVPVATIEAAAVTASRVNRGQPPATVAPECDKARVNDAWLQLVHSDRSGDPPVVSAVDKWNRLCPNSALVSP